MKEYLQWVMIVLWYQERKLHVDVYTLQEYEYMDKIKKAINIISNSIDALNAVAGRMTDIERKNVFYEIRSNIENLYDIGNLFKE